MRRWKGSGWQVWRLRHPYGAWEVSGMPHTAGQRPLPLGDWQHRAAVLPHPSCLFLLGMAPMVCQSSGCAVILVLLEIVGSLVGRQHFVPGRALAAASCSCCVLTSFPDFFPHFHVKKGKPKRSQNHLPPWLKVQIEVLLFYLKKQACSVLEYHCGVFMRETGSTKPHFSPQHRQKMTERDLGPPLSVEGDC